MASEYKGLYVSFEGDSSKLTAALSKINSASRSAQSSLRSVQNALKLDPGSAKLLGAAVEAAGRKVDATKQRIDVLGQGLKSAHEKYDHALDVSKAKLKELEAAGRTGEDAYKMLSKEVSEADGQISRLSRELAQAEAYLRRDQRALIDATNAASGFGKASRYLDSFATSAKSLSGKLTGVGTSLTMGVTAPLAAIALASISAATTVDTALTNVRKTTSLTEDQYQALKDAAIESSKAQPVIADQILNMEALGAQLGWSRDALKQFADVANGLDIATDMNAEQAGTNLAQFANITKMAQGDAERYASSIVGLGNNMATTESKISDMAMGMASAGTQAGMSQADILGVAAAAASLGLESQAGGSAFSKTVNEIGMAVSQNLADLEKWASLAHMSADEFRSAWSEDSASAFQAVVRGMGEAAASGEDLNGILADLGITELRQSDFMRRLAGNSDLLGKAVALSNDEWSKNTALQAEVDNRNESLASKMQVLQNRVAAVVTELGGPLADAALSTVDAARPVTETIEGAARAFSSMSKEERQGVIQTLALTAAAGPALAIAGKVIGVTGSVVSGVGKAVKMAGEVKSATKVMGSFGDALKVLDLKGVAMAGGIGLAVAAVAALGVAVYDHVKTERDFSDALGRMRDSASGVSESLASGARSVTDWGGTSQEAAMGTKELTQAIQEHNEKMSSIRNGAEESTHMLGEYKSVIDRLGGAHTASAEDTAMLEWALKGINEAFETSYTAAQVLSGEYENQEGEIVNLIAEIDNLIAKKQQEAQVNAAQEGYTEALKNELQMKHNLSAAQETYNARVAELSEQYQKAGMSAEAARKTAESVADGEGLRKSIENAEQAYRAAADETRAWAEEMTQAEVAASDLGRAMSDMLQNGDGWAGKLDDTGLSLEQMAGAAVKAGFSTETLSEVGADAFAKLAKSANGNTDTLIQRLTTLNQLHLDPKTFSVNEDGTLTDSTGKVWDLQNMTVDGKHFTVSDDGTITVEGTELAGLSAQQVADKPFTVTSNGTTQAETGSAEDLHNKLDQIPGSYDAYVSAHTASAESNVDSLSSKLYNLVNTGWTAVVHAATGNAAGGVVRHAAGGVRLHAEGAIYTKPTFISPRDVIGEDGAEWYDGRNIVPLTNRTYSQPFADVIADGVISRLPAPAPSGGAEVVAWLERNLPRIISEDTPVLGRRDFARLSKEVAYGQL